MGNAFRQNATPAPQPRCEACATVVARTSDLTFGPDGRQLCRRCYGHLQAAQADVRALDGYGGATLAPVGKFATRNPRVFIRLLILAIGGGFVFVMVAVALAATAGEALRDWMSR